MTRRAFRYGLQFVGSVAVTVLGGIIVWQLTREPPPPPPPVKTPVFEIDHAMVGGPYVVEGSTVDGVYARQGHWWYRFHVVARNGCDESVILHADRFRLYLSAAGATAAEEEVYAPSTKGVGHLADPLQTSGLDAAQRIEGRLVFEVRDGGEASGTVRETALRYEGSLPCAARYR